MKINGIIKYLFSKNFFFKKHWWITLGVSLILITIACRSGLSDRGTLIAGIIAGAFSFSYFVQQQKLAEIRLFKELFTEFNQRYDAINEKLSSIPANIPVNEKNRQTIIDYFNLCSEEYLFKKEGYIHDEVWTAWCRGMSEYFRKEPFCSIWEEEEISGSYYGLTTSKICDGAGLPINHIAGICRGNKNKTKRDTT